MASDVAGDYAIVIGASIAGLLAGRALPHLGRSWEPFELGRM